jgi:hypothetical protein
MSVLGAGQSCGTRVKFSEQRTGTQVREQRPPPMGRSEGVPWLDNELSEEFKAVGDAVKDLARTSRITITATTEPADMSKDHAGDRCAARDLGGRASG